ncbi:putative AAA domain-containing protein [Cryptosporidium canis]|uniref:AAA domain-containing protein n=1 Tax=Cryptosporidium canis TaxID=195482 RepID=A0ABQ8PBW0_9CRYT|nr:putative AAA domain-containing protein [Cryptosporidium canis]
MGVLRFVQRPGEYESRRGDDLVEGSDSRMEWGDEYLGNHNLLEADDTLRGLLIKNLYSMDIQDDVVREILGEGNTSLRPGDILGIMGSLGSGKSLLIMHMIAISILPQDIGGHDQMVYFIDTDSGFSIEFFIEKHLMPIIERNMVDRGFCSSSDQGNGDSPVVSPSDISPDVVDQIIQRSVSNLNVIFANDPLDLLCILKIIISGSSINGMSAYSGNSIGTDTLDLSHSNDKNNNKARLLIVDSLNFWNAELSSLLVSSSPEGVQSKHHILGYYTNRNTLFNSAFSLIRQLVQFHGFIGLVSFSEEPILQTTNNSGYDKFKSNFTEELVEVANLFKSRDPDQDIHDYYDELVKSKLCDLEADHSKEGPPILLKFPRIIHTRIFPSFLAKFMRAEDYQALSNLIWVTRSSFPILLTIFKKAF